MSPEGIWYHEGVRWKRNNEKIVLKLCLKVVLCVKCCVSGSKNAYWNAPERLSPKGWPRKTMP